MAITDRAGLPLAIHLESASPAEVKLAPELICDVKRRTGSWSERLMADKAYVSDHLRYMMKAIDGEMICSHRRNRKRPSLQDGRKLRYKKRRKVERFFSWLFHFNEPSCATSITTLITRGFYLPRLRKTTSQAFMR